ncbi:MAG: diguanylate cyclase [Rhizobiaceae bacterium]|nr:diguanylate cyclase [Rhizobiaceae bacterium]
MNDSAVPRSAALTNRVHAQDGAHGLQFVVAFFRWLSVLPAGERPEIRARLVDWAMETPAVPLVSIFSMAPVALMAAYVTGEWWPYLWMAADVSLAVRRWWLLRMGIGLSGQALERLQAAAMTSGLLWCAILSVGLYFCVATGHTALIVMAAVTAVGVAGSAMGRVAALPRFGAAVMVLCYLPLGLGLAASASWEVRLVALLVPIWLAGLLALMYQTRQTILRTVRAEMATRRAALTDKLTGLPNRAFVEETLALLCNRLPSGETFALLSLDLDGFKQVNDRHGHGAGDLLLKAVAGRLAGTMRAQDTVGRVGGDEFVALLPHASEFETATIAKRLIAAIEQPFDIGLHATVRVGVSVGSVSAPEQGSTPSGLLGCADDALYAAKREGKGRHRTGRREGGGENGALFA